MVEGAFNSTTRPKLLGCSRDRLSGVYRLYLRLFTAYADPTDVCRMGVIPDSQELPVSKWWRTMGACLNGDGVPRGGLCFDCEGPSSDAIRHT